MNFLNKMPHDGFEPPSPASEEGGSPGCSVTPPEDCNGNGTRDLEACECNCDEGYETDYTVSRDSLREHA